MPIYQRLSEFHTIHPLWYFGVAAFSLWAIKYVNDHPRVQLIGQKAYDEMTQGNRERRKMAKAIVNNHRRKERSR